MRLSSRQPKAYVPFGLPRCCDVRVLSFASLITVRCLFNAFFNVTRSGMHRMALIYKMCAHSVVCGAGHTGGSRPRCLPGSRHRLLGGQRQSGCDKPKRLWVYRFSRLLANKACLLRPCVAHMQWSVISVATALKKMLQRLYFSSLFCSYFLEGDGRTATSFDACDYDEADALPF